MAKVRFYMRHPVTYQHSASPLHYFDHSMCLPHTGTNGLRRRREQVELRRYLPKKIFYMIFQKTRYVMEVRRKFIAHTNESLVRFPIGSENMSLDKVKKTFFRFVVFMFWGKFDVF